MKTRRRVLAALLAAVMAVSMMPASIALPEEAPEGSITVEMPAAERTEEEPDPSGEDGGPQEDVPDPDVQDETDPEPGEAGDPEPPPDGPEAGEEPEPEEPGAGAPETPDDAAPDAEVPDAEKPGEEQSDPDAEAPDPETPEAEDPGDEPPGAEQPEEETPGGELPGTGDQSPDVPEDGQPEPEAPDAEDPEEEPPAAEEPGEGSPDSEEPDTESPDAGENEEPPAAEDPGADSQEPETDPPSHEEPGTEPPAEEGPGTDAPSEDPEDSHSVGLVMPQVEDRDAVFEFHYTLTVPEGHELDIDPEGTFTLSPGESHTLDSLPDGTEWTLEMTAPDGYEFRETSWSGTIDGEDAVITPEPADSWSVTVDMPAVPDEEAEFEFRWTLTAPEGAELDPEPEGTFVLHPGESHALESLPDGTEWTLEMTAPEGYEFKEMAWSGTIDGEDVAVTPEPADSWSVTVDMPGVPDEEAEFEFRWTLTAPEGAELDPEPEGAFVLHPGESHTLDSLPDGTEWMLDMTAPEGYEFRETTWSGTIDGEDVIITPEPAAGQDEEPEAEATEYVCELEGDVTVTASASPGANLPEDAVLSVERLEEGSEAYRDAVRAAVLNADLPDGLALCFIPYDVCFLSGDETIEPDSGTVTVSMKFDRDPFAEVEAEHPADGPAFEGPSFEGEIKPDAEPERTAVHILDSGTVEEPAAEWLSGRELKFRVGSFSVMGPAMVIEGSSQTSSDMGDFLKSVEILDKENNRPVPEGQLKEGDYKIKLHFEDDPSKFFAPATEEELREALKEAGIQEDEIEQAVQAWKADGGEWMFVQLGDDVRAKEGVNGDENVKVFGDGRFLLVRYRREANGAPFDNYDIEFEGTLSRGSDDGTYDIVESTENGTYTPPQQEKPYMKKEAVSYNPETHSIKYQVTVTNPTENDTLDGFLFEDTFSSAASVSQPELKKGTLQVAGVPVPEENVESGNGKFSFHSDRTIPPGGSVTVEYELDVEKIVEELGLEAADFLVHNEAAVTPEGGTVEQEPFGDYEDYEVDLGTLTKRGGITHREGDDKGLFYGYDCVMEWEIKAYDPYSQLYSLKLSDTLELEGKPINPDIIGLRFCYYEDGVEKWLTYMQPAEEGSSIGSCRPLQELIECKFLKIGSDGTVTFDFNNAPPELKNQMLYENGHRLKMRVYTHYKPGKDGYGYYENTVSGTLPSEQQEREASDSLNVGDPGVHTEKEGKLTEDGKLHYTVEATVSSHIEELSENNWGAWGIGAGLLERLYVMDNNQKNFYLDIYGAITMISVKAAYDDGGVEKTYEFTRLPENAELDGTHPKNFGVYCVGLLKDQNHEDPGSRVVLHEHEGKENYKSHVTAIVLNPETGSYQDSSGKYTVIKGNWPEELDSQEVELTVEYEIDPAKAFFVSTKDHKLEGYQGCSTLLEYLSMKGSIIVTNYVYEGVKSSLGEDSTTVPMTIPMTKKGTSHVDLKEGRKYITYEVTFQNGVNNAAFVPKDAENLVFHDQFDSRMTYAPGTLKATLYENGGVENPAGTAFSYTGTDSPVSPAGSSEITASWSEFQDYSGRTLQQAFNAQNGQYNIRFTYQLIPNSVADWDCSKAYTDISNNAWVSYGDGKETPHVTSSVDFPTGALTKQGQLENGAAAFYVEVNEHGKDMNTPAEGELDALTVTDTAESKYLQLDWDSIRVQKPKAGGGWEDLPEGEPPDGFQKDLSVSLLNHSQVLTLKVPDEQHLRIWYSYSLTDEGRKYLNSSDDAEVMISNTVTIAGRTGVSDGGSWGFGAAGFGEGGSGGSKIMTISKFEKGTGIPIQNARFILYTENTAGTETPEAAQEAARISMPVLTLEDSAPPDDSPAPVLDDSEPDADGGIRTFYPVEVYTTGEDGTGTADWIYLRENTVYALVESDVPAGFVRMEEPVFFKLIGNSVVPLEGHYNEDLVSAGSPPAAAAIDSDEPAAPPPHPSLHIANEFRSVTLPETGGPGPACILIPSLAACAAGVFLLLPERKRRGKKSRSSAHGADHS